MTESETYAVPTDGSTIKVGPSRAGADGTEPVLQLIATETGQYAIVDLTRADVQNLIQYAQEWLEDTKPKPPTTPGSVVRIPSVAASTDVTLTRLNKNGKAAFELAHSLGLWVSQSGTFWTDDELMDIAGDRFEVVYDAGKAE